jgi:hypothetical protein
LPKINKEAPQGPLLFYFHNFNISKINALMRKILFLLFSIFCFWGHAQWKSNGNDLLPNNLRMAYSVKLGCFQESPEDTLCKGGELQPYIKAKWRINLPDYILNRFSTRKIAVWEPNTSDFFPYNVIETRKSLTFEAANNAMGGGADTLNVMNDDGSIIQKVVIREIDIKQIKGLHFIEDWIFDAQNFKMTKKVVAYEPIRLEYPDGNGEQLRVRLPFRIVDTLGKMDNRKKIFIGNVSSEFYIDNENRFWDSYELIYKQFFGETQGRYGFPEIWGCPFWNSLTRNYLINQVCLSAIEGKRQAFDFESGQLLDPDEISKRIIGLPDTLQILNAETGEPELRVVSRSFSPEMINSFIFIEDWYIDPESLVIEKVVKGIAPVLYKLKDDGQVRKQIPFFVNFSK